MTGGISFRGFVEELAAQAEKADAPEALVLEEAADGVRLMTVHRAKGLEFPVVILADMTANLTAARAGPYVDPDAVVRHAAAALRALGTDRSRGRGERTRAGRGRARGLRGRHARARPAGRPGVGDEERRRMASPAQQGDLSVAQDNWRNPRTASYSRSVGTARCSTGPLDTISLDDPSVKPGLHTPQAAPMKWCGGILRRLN